jgi:hypothetical protein
MGNHSAGQSMALGAAHALQTRQPGQTAISLLDKVCARYVDCDAEFESEDPDNPGTVHPEFDDYTAPHPNAALGMLMVEAFSPNGLTDLPHYAAMLDTDNPECDSAYDRWREDVYQPFRTRYRFC